MALPCQKGCFGCGACVCCLHAWTVSMPVQEFLNSLRIPNEPSWIGLPSCTTAVDRRAVSGSSVLQSLHETPGNDPQLVNTAQRKTPETTVF